MAKKKISALPIAGSLLGAEIVPIVQTGTTKQTTIQDIVNLVETEGGINGSGTANRISKFIDANTIGDSSISDDLTILQTYSQESGGNEGLKLDYANRSYKLGEFDYNVNGTIFEVNDDLKFILTKYSGNNVGLYFDFLNNVYSLGDFDYISIGTAYVVDSYKAYTKSEGGIKGLGIDFNENAYTLGVPEGNDYVSGVVGFSMINEIITIGDGWASSTALKFVVDIPLNLIKTQTSGYDCGLKVDFDENIYAIGDYANERNTGTSLIIDDLVGKIKTRYNNTDSGFFIDYGDYSTSFQLDYNPINTGNYIQLPRINQAIGNLAGNQSYFNHNLFAYNPKYYLQFGQYLPSEGDGGASLQIVMTESGDWGQTAISLLGWNPEEGFLLQNANIINLNSLSPDGAKQCHISLNGTDERISFNTKAVNFGPLTTTEINNILNPIDGDVAYNTTLNTICFYDGSSWKKVTHSAM
jgi:hypothetical protein